MSDSLPISHEKTPPKLRELFSVFLRISAITIGGGYVMLPMFKSEVVDLKKWISDEELIDYYALGQSVPGVIAVNTATLIGYRKRGVFGALISAFGMMLPSLIVIISIAAFLVQYLDNPFVQKAFAGIRAAVVGLIAMAVWNIGKGSVKGGVKIVISVLAFICIVAFHLSPVLVLLSGAALGFFLFKEKPVS